jgi:hypothetical protein
MPGAHLHVLVFPIKRKFSFKGIFQTIGADRPNPPSPPDSTPREKKQKTNPPDVPANRRIQNIKGIGFHASISPPLHQHKIGQFLQKKILQIRYFQENSPGQLKKNKFFLKKRGIFLVFPS